MAGEGTDQAAGRRWLAGRQTRLKWAFALAVAVGVFLDVFSYGSELGRQFVGWDMNVLQLGKQTDLDDLEQNVRDVEKSMLPDRGSDAATRGRTSDQ